MDLLTDEVGETSGLDQDSSLSLRQDTDSLLQNRGSSKDTHTYVHKHKRTCTQLYEELSNIFQVKPVTVVVSYTLSYHSDFLVTRISVFVIQEKDLGVNRSKY